MEEEKNQQNNNQTSGIPPKDDTASILSEVEKAKALGKELLSSVSKEESKESLGPKSELADTLRKPPKTIPLNKIEDSFSKKGPLSQERPNPETSPTQETENEGEVTDKMSSIRTYASDISRLIKEGVTLSDVALSEQERKVSRNKSLKPSKKKVAGVWNIKIISIAVIFIILGISALSYVFLFGEDKPENPVSADIPSLIFSNTDTEFPVGELKGLDLLKEVNQSRVSAQGVLGSVTNLYLTTGGEVKRLLEAREFLEKTGVQARGSFIRSLEKDFMIGIHSFNGNQGFLIFRIDSFENALPGMLDWEKVLLDDLWPMFYDEKPLINIIDENATSSPSIQRRFEDQIIRNKDVRTLENDEGIVFLYSFIDKKHLIITTERSTFVEVIDRLTTDRFKN